MPKPEANAVLIAHLSAIVEAMKETGSATRAWETMPPALTTAIQKATFTARVPIMAALHAYMVEQQVEQHAKVEHEVEQLRHQWEEAERERLNTVEQLAKAREQLNKVEQTPQSEQVEQMVEQVAQLNKELNKLEAARLNMVEHIATLEGEVEQRVEQPPHYLNGEQQVEQPAKVEQTVEQLEGWKVTQDKRGYYRLVKKINGRVRAVHIGRDWSREEAIEKLRQWEAKHTPNLSKDG